MHSTQLCAAIDARAAADVILRLVLQQSHEADTRSHCQTLAAPTTRVLHAGISFDFSGGPIAITAHFPTVDSHANTYDPAHGNRISARAGTLHLTLRSADRNRPVSVCD